MKRTILHLSLLIPVTYDDTKMSEKAAFDAVEKVATEAVTRAIDGRNIGPDGTYLDHRGPQLVDDQPITPIPARCTTHGKCNGKVLEKDGFYKCERCGVSWGSVQ
jgi:hypothetical protein